MKKLILTSLAASALIFASCANDDDVVPVIPVKIQDPLPVATKDTPLYEGVTTKVLVYTNDTTGDVVVANTVRFTNTGLSKGSVISSNRKTITVKGEGVWKIDVAGVVTFTPNATFNGVPSVVYYTVKDKQGNTSNQAAINFVSYVGPVDPVVDPVVGPVNPGGTLVIPDTYEFSCIDKDYTDRPSVDNDVSNYLVNMASELKIALGYSDDPTSSGRLKYMFQDAKFFSNKIWSRKSEARLIKKFAKGAKSTYTKSSELKTKFEGWLKGFEESVKGDASKGVAGVIADGDKKRVVDAKGFELNQAAGKTMIGAVQLDQIVNDLLSESGLNEDATPEGNDELDSGKFYTDLEHRWDTAYGYVFTKVGEPGKLALLGKYLKKVGEMSAFKGTYEKVELAFRTGRAAVVAKNYTVMQEQAAIIRTELSKVVAVRAVHYLLTDKGAVEANIHGLSEGYGFVHALLFAHVNGGQIAASEVEPTISIFESGNGLWDDKKADYSAAATKFATMFGFTVADAK